VTAGITPELCQRCAACCSAVVDGALVACRHLVAEADRYHCAIYATRPLVCRDFDCMRDGEPSPAIADRVRAAMEAGLPLAVRA
jgi:Fe-S-cluster containining protein